MLRVLAKDGVLDIYFVSGVHGVGKGTLCKELSSIYNIEIHSCSDIIKANSEYVEDGKMVQDANGNQSALAIGLKKMSFDKIMLDGHFCLLDKSKSVVDLDYRTFDEINPKKIITVTCDVNDIYVRLKNRDGISPEVNLIEEFQSQELKRAIKYANLRDIPHFNYISGDDLNDVVEWLER